MVQKIRRLLVEFFTLWFNFEMKGDTSLACPTRNDKVRSFRFSPRKMNIETDPLGLGITDHSLLQRSRCREALQCPSHMPSLEVYAQIWWFRSISSEMEAIEAKQSSKGGSGGRGRKGAPPIALSESLLAEVKDELGKLPPDLNQPVHIDKGRKLVWWNNNGERIQVTYFACFDNAALAEHVALSGAELSRSLQISSLPLRQVLGKGLLSLRRLNWRLACQSRERNIDFPIGGSVAKMFLAMDCLCDSSHAQPRGSVATERFVSEMGYCAWAEALTDIVAIKEDLPEFQLPRASREKYVDAYARESPLQMQCYIVVRGNWFLHACCR